MILKVEAGTFSQLELLETLDLSSNGLRSVPSDILNLPFLRKLYLADNELHNEGFNAIKKPVRAPLVYLNIAITEIDRIPDLGILAELLTLNVSGNTLKQLTPQQFAPLCQLKFVDLNQTRVDACQCLKINIFMEIELKRSPILKCGAAPKSKFQNTLWRQISYFMYFKIATFETIHQQWRLKTMWPAWTFKRSWFRSQELHQLRFLGHQLCSAASSLCCS